MSPRPYRLGQREATREATRSRIIEAAGELLASAGFTSFTIEAVARAADVSPMTVYNQFASKAGLLEAVFDRVAQQGQVQRLAEAASEPDADQGLARFVHACCALWASNRIVQRRLVGLAAIDLDFEATLQAREQRRAGAARAVLSRMPGPDGRPKPRQLDTAVDWLMALTSFATVDALAGPHGDPVASATLVETLVRCALAQDS